MSSFSPPPPRRVILSGGSGFVGSALARALRLLGFQVDIISRSAERGAIVWDPKSGVLDSRALEGAYAVIHLAGANLAARRWSASFKREIQTSRTESTALISHTIASLATPPQVFVSASAVGIYGDRGEEILHETSSPGSGFLAEVTTEWEASTRPAVDAGIRVVCARLGAVLSPEGGVLKKLLLPFSLGVGGPLGGGDQWMSWVALEDVIGAISFVLEHRAMSGPINVVAPMPVRNTEFTRALAHALRRPAVLRVPSGPLRWIAGELADELLLASTRVNPRRLLDAGFQFRHPELSEALRVLLSR